LQSPKEVENKAKKETQDRKVWT